MILQGLLYFCFITGPLFIWAGINRLRSANREGFEAIVWGSPGITLGAAAMGWAACADYRLYVIVPRGG